MDWFSVAQTIVTLLVIPYLGKRLGGYLTTNRRLADAQRLALIAATVVIGLKARFPGKPILDLVELGIEELKQTFPTLPDAVARRVLLAAEPASN